MTGYSSFILETYDAFQDDDMASFYPHLRKISVSSLGDGLEQLVRGFVGDDSNNIKPEDGEYVLLSLVNNVYDTYVVVYGGELSYDNLFIIQIQDDEMIYGQGDKWLVDTAVDIVDLIDEYYDDVLGFGSDEDGE